VSALVESTATGATESVAGATTAVLSAQLPSHFSAEPPQDDKTKEEANNTIAIFFIVVFVFVFIIVSDIIYHFFIDYMV